MHGTWPAITLVLVTILCVTNCAQASELKRDKSGKIRQTAATAALQKGGEVRSAGETYILLPEARAVQRRDGSRNASEDALQVLSEMGVNAQEVLEKKGRFIIYRTPPSAEAMSRGPKLTANGEPVYPVVLNRRTGQLGVVPGQIVVRLKDASQAQSLADDFGVGLVTVFKHLNTAFYQVAFEQDPFAVSGDMAGDFRVLSATVEILENVNVPH